MNTKLNRFILACVLTMLVSNISLAQGVNPPPPPTPPPPPGLLVDGGLIALFVVALIYGVHKSLKLSKKLS